MGKKHVSADKELTNEEVSKIRKKIKGHTSMLIRILELVRDSSHTAKFRKSLSDYVLGML